MNQQRPFNYPPAQQNYSLAFEYPEPAAYSYNPQLYPPASNPQIPQPRQYTFAVQKDQQSYSLPRGTPLNQASQYTPPVQQPVQTPQHGQNNARQSQSPDRQASVGASGRAAEAELERQLMEALNDDTQQQQQDAIDLAQAYPNQGDENDPVYKLPPPAEATFPSQAAMEKSMHEWSLMHGYELVRRASKKNAQGVIYKRYWDCARHARKRSSMVPEHMKRKAKKSNDSQCPMSLATVAVDPSDPGGQWQIRHRKTHHNHPADDAKSLAGHRRRFRDENVQRAIDGLFAIGTSTAQVVQFLQRTSPNGLFTRTDVANMKIKWRKYGTCMVKHGEGAEVLAKKLPRPPTPLGACHRCRTKHQACDSKEPRCGTCIKVGAECTYDRRNRDRDRQIELDDSTMIVYDGPSAPTSAQQQAIAEHAAPDVTPSASARRPRFSQTKKAATIEILEQLSSAQNNRYAPKRLELQSSEVEILAQSSCGNGSSYEHLPLLAGPNEWPNFRDCVIQASRKENTYDVLVGTKSEPTNPGPIVGMEGGPAEVESWNEYIKQLAIYRRRNELLLSALTEHMTPYYRSRVVNMSKASAVWDALENLFQPRGCEVAFRLFLDLHSIHLDTSKDLKDYIHRMQSTYERFKKLPLNTSPTSMGPASGRPHRPRDGSEAVPEEMVCLLFLQNLGPEWRRWVDGLCATNNIGGFGTGERLGLKDLCKRAVGYEAMQRRELGRT